MSLVDRLARLFREPASETAAHGGTADDASSNGTDSYRCDGGDEGHETEAVAVVVQEPPAGVRRYELTVRAGVPVETVEPGLLARLFETFDDGTGVVRARSVDVDGNGKTIEGAVPLFTVRFAEAVDPETVSVDGTLTGHDEEAVPWSRVRLTPVE